MTLSSRFTRLIFVVGLVSISSGVGCAKSSPATDTTTIRSGATEGPRVTGIRTATPVDSAPAERLAGEICRREATCHEGASPRSEETRLLDEQVCVTRATGRTRDVMSTWDCSPSLVRAGYERCLAAIKNERCETRIDTIERIPACTRAAICERLDDLPPR